MFETFASLITLGLLLFAVVGGYATARRFVRERLRYVDAVQRRSAPLVAGLGAWGVGLLAALLPFVGVGTAIAFGVAVGLGVAAGARDIRTGRLLPGS